MELNSLINKLYSLAGGTDGTESAINWKREKNKTMKMWDKETMRLRFAAYSHIL